MISLSVNVAATFPVGVSGNTSMILLIIGVFTVSALASCGWVTVKPLLFNDPVQGVVFEVATGEPCVLLESVIEAKRRGFLSDSDKQAIWAATTNLQRGYCLVWLRGVLRGVSAEDIERRG